MQAVAVAGSLGAAAAAGSVAQCARRRGGFAAGRQLRQAASNGSRCNAFFKFGNKDKEKGANGAPADAGAAWVGRACSCVCGSQAAGCPLGRPPVAAADLAGLGPVRLPSRSTCRQLCHSRQPILLASRPLAPRPHCPPPPPAVPPCALLPAALCSAALCCRVLEGREPRRLPAQRRGGLLHVHGHAGKRGGWVGGWAGGWAGGGWVPELGGSLRGGAGAGCRCVGSGTLVLRCPGTESAALVRRCPDNAFSVLPPQSRSLAVLVCACRSLQGSYQSRSLAVLVCACRSLQGSYDRCEAMLASEARPAPLTVAGMLRSLACGSPPPAQPQHLCAPPLSTAPAAFLALLQLSPVLTRPALPAATRPPLSPPQAASRRWTCCC